MCVSLLLLVGVELALTLSTLPWHSMALHGTPWHSMSLHGGRLVVKYLRSASPASMRFRSLLSKGSVPAFPKTWAKHVCVALASRGRQTILPLTCGFTTSARIASSCFTRPRFELALASHAPVSAKRVRLSCSINSRVFAFMRHDVFHVGPSTPHLTSSPLASVVISLGVFSCRHVAASQFAWTRFL